MKPSLQTWPTSALKRGRMAFRLYVAGDRPNSIDAHAKLRAVCAESGKPTPRIEVVDVLREPRRAMKDGIIATPTVIRISPKPMLTFLGSLADSSHLRAALGLG
jgi:circadian clock protein KaiB